MRTQYFNLKNIHKNDPYCKLQYFSKTFNITRFKWFMVYTMNWTFQMVFIYFMRTFREITVANNVASFLNSGLIFKTNA